MVKGIELHQPNAFVASLFLCIARLEIPTEDIQVGMAGYGLENTQADPGVVCIRQARTPPRVSGRAIDAQVSTDLTQGYVRRLPCQVLALRVAASTWEQKIRTLGRPPVDALPLVPPCTKLLGQSVIDVCDLPRPSEGCTAGR